MVRLLLKAKPIPALSGPQNLIPISADQAAAGAATQLLTPVVLVALPDHSAVERVVLLCHHRLAVRVEVLVRGALAGLALVAVLMVVTPHLLPMEQGAAAVVG